MKIYIFMWTLFGLPIQNEQFQIQTKNYEISTREGEGIELKCESDKRLNSFVWKRKNSGRPRWSVIYNSSSEVNLSEPWSRMCSFNHNNLLCRNVTDDLNGSYACLDSEYNVISQVNVTIHEPCVSMTCPQVEHFPCTCPTKYPNMATTASGPLHQDVTSPVTFTNRPTFAEAMQYMVECPRGDCQSHWALFCRRDEWKLSCEDADPKCASSEVAAEASTMMIVDWQKILHFSLHGFMLLVILSLLVYVCHLRKVIGQLTSLERYEMPVLRDEEGEVKDIHRYATGGNTYDFIADVRSREDDYAKYLKLISAKDSELPAIPDYLEVIT